MIELYVFDWEFGGNQISDLLNDFTSSIIQYPDRNLKQE